MPVSIKIDSLEHMLLSCFSRNCVALQVVAYNKIDVPDSGDYIDDVREFLLSEGVPAEDFFAISAATGTGVLDLVRRVHKVLDALPMQVRLLSGNMWHSMGSASQDITHYIISVKARTYFCIVRRLERGYAIQGYLPSG